MFRKWQKCGEENAESTKREKGKLLCCVLPHVSQFRSELEAKRISLSALTAILSFRGASVPRRRESYQVSVFSHSFYSTEIGFSFPYHQANIGRLLSKIKFIQIINLQWIIQSVQENCSKWKKRKRNCWVKLFLLNCCERKLEFVEVLSVGRLVSCLWNIRCESCSSKMNEANNHPEKVDHNTLSFAPWQLNKRKLFFLRKNLVFQFFFSIYFQF